jgi:hypothetical protein
MWAFLRDGGVRRYVCMAALAEAAMTFAILLRKYRKCQVISLLPPQRQGKGQRSGPK